MARRDDASRYALLRRHLAALPAEADTVTLTFAAIETMIGAWLPDAARVQGWWANSADGRPQAWAWLDAGWRVASVTVGRAEAVTFVRADSTA